VPKPKAKGFKLKKGLVVKGIKIKDATTKKQVKEIIKNEAANKMNID